MRLVKATNASHNLKVRIKELGRIATEGEVFQVTDDRYLILAGSNRYKTVFVTAISDKSPITPISTIPKKVESPKASRAKVLQNNDSLIAKIDTTIVDEQPEIWLIEPGKEKVLVDENMIPIVEKAEKVAEEPPKKKRGRPKKSTVEQKIENISAE